MPNVSIRVKLYAIFSLLAMAVAALAAMTVTTSRINSRLADEVNSASKGLENIKKTNGSFTPW